MFSKHVKGLEELGEDQSNIMLFLLAFGSGTVEQKLEYLIHLLQQSEKGNEEEETKAPTKIQENIQRERAAEILHRLFVLTSVEILEEIQALNYLTKSEIYS